MRRMDRKLDIQRGMALTYDDLALLVASGAYAKLQDANREYWEHQCREHVARSRSTYEEHFPLRTARAPLPDHLVRSPKKARAKR